MTKLSYPVTQERERARGADRPRVEDTRSTPCPGESSQYAAADDCGGVHGEGELADATPCLCSAIHLVRDGRRAVATTALLILALAPLGLDQQLDELLVRLALQVDGACKWTSRRVDSISRVCLQSQVVK